MDELQTKIETAIQIIESIKSNRPDLQNFLVDAIDRLTEFSIYSKLNARPEDVTPEQYANALFNIIQRQ